MSTDSGSFMQNEANSGVSRTKHRSAGRAGSWHAETLGPPDLGFGIFDLGFSIMPEPGTHAARNGTGTRG